jgi:hypothetical protein
LDVEEGPTLVVHVLIEQVRSGLRRECGAYSQPASSLRFAKD